MPSSTSLSSASTIQIEFFGVVRQRAGCSQAVLSFSQFPVSFSEVLQALGQQFPGFAQDCLNAEGHLPPGYLANLNADRFLTSGEETVLQAGDSLLIFSADAGG